MGSMCKSLHYNYLLNQYIDGLMHDYDVSNIYYDFCELKGQPLVELCSAVLCVILCHILSCCTQFILSQN